MPAPIVPQAQAYRSDGTPIDPAELSQAVDAGEAFFDAADQVSIVNPYGVTERVSGADVATRVANGWQIEGAERVQQREEAQAYGTAGQAALAALEGGARGLSFGTYDLAAAAIDPEYAREAALRQEHQGGAAMAGELAGALAPALLTGGTSLGATAGATAGRSALGRVGAAALRSGLTGAAEGALYGGATATARELREERLTTDPSGSAARILADVGMYGLLGGALGGGIAGLGRATGELAAAAPGMLTRRLGAEVAEAGAEGAAKTGREGLAAVADREARKAIAGRAGESLPEGIGERLMREGVDVTDPERALVRVKELADGAQERMASAVRGSDVRVSVDALRQRVDTMIAGLDPAVVPLDVAKALRKASKPLTDLQAELAKRGSDGTISLERLTTLSREMRAQGAAVQSAGKKGAAKLSIEAKKALVDLAETFDGAVGEALDTAADRKAAAGLDFSAAAKGGQSAGEAYRAARRDLSTYLRVQSAAERHVKALQAQGAGANPLSSGLQSTMTAASVAGAVMSGNPAALLGMAVPAAMRLVRERGSGIAARLAYAASRGDMRVGQLADRLLGKPALAIQQVGRRASAASGRGARAAGRAARSWSDRYQELAAPVVEARDRPEETQRRLAASVSEVAEVYPELAAELVAQTTGGLAALASRLPRSVARPSLTPQAAPAVISPEAMRDFVRAAEAMTDPERTLDAIESGEATWQDLQALRDGQPQVWSAIRMSLLERVSEMRTELPFARRITIGLAFDLPGADYSLDPVAGAALQAVEAAPPEPPRAPPRPGPTQSARWAGQLKLAGDRATRGG